MFKGKLNVILKDKKQLHTWFYLIYCIVLDKQYSLPDNPLESDLKSQEPGKCSCKCSALHTVSKLSLGCLPVISQALIT